MSGPGMDLANLVGTTIGGKYRIDSVLGRGGMGAVFQATNQAIGKKVALKFLYRDAAQDLDAVTRFQREAEAASAVESAHIVQIFDSGTTADGLPFLVMELLRGEDLRTRLQREGKLPVAEVIHIAGHVARGLRSAHEAGIVHRDLKPDNIFLCERDDDPMFVKIVDFGISKVARRSPNADTLTHQGVVLGTAFYMSPEQARAERDIDGRTDLFSLGTIMYEALAGRPPHVGNAYEAVLIDICTQDAPSVREFAPEVPEPVAQVLSRALERDRELRFPSAQELYDALVEAVPGLLQPTVVSGLGPRLATPAAPQANAERPPSPVDGPGSGTDALRDQPSFATAEGTAVRSAAPPTRRRTRRAVILGTAAAVAAFSLTALLLSRSLTPDPDGDTAHGVSADAPQDTLAAPPVAPSVTAPSASSSADQHDAAVGTPADAPPRSSTQAAADANAAGPAGGRLRPSARRPGRGQLQRPKPKRKLRPVRADPVGVAKGLKLVTEP